MQKLFSIHDKKLLSPINKSEKDLQQFICDNWNDLFPEYIFITQEFKLKGAVHPSGSSGRMDILAYNPATKRFVFFELKKNYDKNVGHQAADYRHYINKNFSDVYVEALQKHNAAIPDKAIMNDKEVEMILIAKEFSSPLIDQAETENLVALIEYDWFENDLVLLAYVHNAPDGKNDSTGPDDPKEPPKKWIDRMVEKGWDANINSMQPASIKKQLQAIPFTKENIDQLKELAAEASSEAKRSILNKLLEKLEAEDTI